jgi:predicted nucleic acid-binding protein
MERPKVYIETSVISYLTARPSKGELAKTHQALTQQWWKEHLDLFQPFVSDLVIREASRGDELAAKRRLSAISGIKVLVVTEAVLNLAELFMKELGLPPKAGSDAYHMAIAAMNEMDYLVTWNCRHIAAGYISRRMPKVLAPFGLQPPFICTPEVLIHGTEEG